MCRLIWSTALGVASGVPGVGDADVVYDVGGVVHGGGGGVYDVGGVDGVAGAVRGTDGVVHGVSGVVFGIRGVGGATGVIVIVAVIGSVLWLV